MCTLGTQYGSCAFFRLPYVIKSAPESKFRKIFKIDGVDTYINEILVWDKDKKEHDSNPKQYLILQKLIMFVST